MYSLLSGYKDCDVSRHPLIMSFGSFVSLFIFCPIVLSWIESSIELPNFSMLLFLLAFSAYFAVKVAAVLLDVHS